jgi:hypothetical protein
MAMKLGYIPEYEDIPNLANTRFSEYARRIKNKVLEKMLEKNKTDSYANEVFDKYIHEKILDHLKADYQFVKEEKKNRKITNRIAKFVNSQYGLKL